MPIADRNRVYDGFANLAGGVDDGRLPNLIDKNQCFEAQNAVMRGGAPDNRPPFREVELTFENPNLTYTPDGTFFSSDGIVGAARTAFQTTKLQEASYFGQSPGKEWIMVTCGGRHYRITPGIDQTAVVRAIELNRRNNENIPIAYHLQAGVYHILQDGEATPVIYDGVSARRATYGEIPIGRMMGYGQGRIVLVANNGDIFFGDIRDGHGNGDTDLLKFEETLFLAEGFPSALPSGMGFPTAVQFIPQQDTATGVGECLVLGQNGIESFYLSLPRETWKDSAFQKTALLGIGNAGHRSVAVTNEDIWFRSQKDGWRSYRQARAQVNQWAQIPMSTNVRRWIDEESKSLLEFCSVISFNDRLIATVNPYPNQGRPYNNGLISLDFDILSTFGNLTNPAWDGHWTNWNQDYERGLRVTRLVEGQFNGTQRAFMFYINPAGQNAMREIMPTPAGNDTDGKITSWILTRSLDFDSPFNEKEIYGGDLWFDKVTDDPVDVSVSYRPDQVPDLTPWQDVAVTEVGTPGSVTPGMVPTIREGFSPRKKLKKPSDVGDPLNTKRIMRRGYEFQAKIQWSGRARIRKFRVHAQQLVEDSKATIP